MEQIKQHRVAVSEDGWITVETYGRESREGLVLLPGVMSDASGWGAVARELRRWPSVSVINRRGRAPSSVLPRGYTLRTEVEDLFAVLQELGGADAIFGWSFGGLVALIAGNEQAFRHVIAYEPVIAPFARHALDALKVAAIEECWDRSVEIVNEDISGFSREYVDRLRADHDTWTALRRLSEPLYRELAALNEAPTPVALAQRVERIDLIVGECSVDTPPYGHAFEEVRRLLHRPRVSVLAGQGHLAHLQAPGDLAGLLDRLSDW